MSVVGREPRRFALAALAVGLVLGAHTPGVIWAAAALVAVAVLRVAGSGEPLVAAAVATALVAGAGFGQARTAALEHSVLDAPRALAGARLTLTEAPRPDGSGGMRARAQLRSEPVLMRVPPGVALPRAADTGVVLAVSGRLRTADRSARNVHADATVTVRLARIVGRRGGLAGIVDSIRRRAVASLAQGVPDREAALLSGMVLGQDARLPPRLDEAMRAASLSHLTAASGQNVALLAAVAALAGVVAGAGVRARLVLALALIAVYVPLAGAGPSIVRAAIMGAATIVAALAGRPGSRADALALAAALTLAIDPRSAADLGWQLSFAAVAGIAVFGGTLGRLLESARVPRAPAAVLAVTAAATLTTAPVLALTVGQSPLMALPANVAAAPAVPAVMGLGVAAALLGQASQALAAPVALLASLPAAYIAALGTGLGEHPLALQRVSPLVVVGVSILAGAVLLLGRRRRRSGEPRTTRRRSLRALLVTAAVAAILTVAGSSRRTAEAPAPGVLRVTALDVGQGDATLLEAGAAKVLVDTGPPGGALMRRLRDAGAARLDALVLTHPELDHVGAAAELLDRVPVGLVVDGRDRDRAPLSRSIDAPLARSGARVVVAAAGQTVTAGPITMRVLSPPDEPNGAASVNDRAVVIEAAAFGRTVLLPADAESSVLALLGLRPVDLLKVSHHGSADPGLVRMLAVLRPRIALIEVGRGNRYGHPTASTLAALAAAGVAVARTDRDGTVAVELGRGGGVSARRAGP